MGEPRSPHETSNDLLASFHMGYLKQISHQIATMRAEQRSEHQQLRASTDLLLVYTGQNTEALRRMEKPTAPSGPDFLTQMKKVLDFLGALYKAWPVIRWAMYANGFAWAAKHVARFFGWL